MLFPGTSRPPWPIYPDTELRELLELDGAVII